MESNIEINIIPLPDSPLRAYAIGYSDGMLATEAIDALENAIAIIQQGVFIEAKMKGYSGHHADAVAKAIAHKNQLLMETIMPHTIVNLDNLEPQ